MTSKSVLIIESDASYAESLSVFFEDLGFDIVHAEDGREGIKVLNKVRPALIILSVELPTISGYSVCKKLKRHKVIKSIPLALTTSNADEGGFSQHRKLKTHADFYFTKPFTPQELWEEASDMVATPTLEHEEAPAPEPSSGDVDGPNAPRSDEDRATPSSPETLTPDLEAGSADIETGQDNGTDHEQGEGEASFIDPFWQDPASPNDEEVFGDESDTDEAVFGDEDVLGDESPAAEIQPPEADEDSQDEPEVFAASPSGVPVESDDTDSEAVDASGSPDTVIQRRKADHIDLCTKEDVEFRLKTTLLEEVHLVHQSLAELDFDDLDLTTEFLGKEITSPLCISGMTGGTLEASSINRELARLAQEVGIAFGVGSQRAMLLDPSIAHTYMVRDIAPDIPLLANIGVVQAASSSTDEIRTLVETIGADALCVHLNPAQELVQEGGDRNFKGTVAAIERLVSELDIPIIAKETGCGISRSTAAALTKCGVGWVDVSGAGGTTWVGVETLRASPHRRLVGEDFWEWGIPTAASIRFAVDGGLETIASGGIRNGHDVARALALGATVASMALPFLRALKQDGFEGAHAHYLRVIEGLKIAMVLTGSETPMDLETTPRRIGPNLRDWFG